MNKTSKQKIFSYLALALLFLMAASPFLVLTVHADYVINVSAYDISESTAVDPVIYADGVSQGAAPQAITYIWGDTGVTISADLTDSYDNPLKGWLCNGYLILANMVFITSNDIGSFTAVYESTYVPPDPDEGGTGSTNETSGGGWVQNGTGSTNGNYTFYGLNNELSGVNVGAVIVTAYYNVAGRFPEMFMVNGTYHYSTNAVPYYFQYNITADNPRQYWLQPSETSGSFYILNSTTLTTYVINFMDYTGALKSNPYVSAQAYVNGSLVTVEKRKVDSQDSVIMSLINGERYHFVISGETTFDYGDLLMTSITGVQLVLRGVDFSQKTAGNTLLLYQYVHAYSVRDFLNPVGAITVSYGDITNKTNSVTITITNASDNTVAFTQVFSGISYQTFSYQWIYADNATNYEVTVTIDHETFGAFHFSQYLLGEYTKASDPFTLDFLGTIGVSTAWFIPALLIIFVAGCFSELTSEAGAIITVIIAIILSAMGWISISSSALIVALALSIMAGVITARRRFT